MKPKIADTKPLSDVVDPGRYYWCACGRSSRQPYCDGSHIGTGITPVEVEFDTTKEVYFCMCKHSKNKPFCDGSHRKI